MSYGMTGFDNIDAALVLAVHQAVLNPRPANCRVNSQHDQRDYHVHVVMLDGERDGREDDRATEWQSAAAIPTG